ncbi:MAG TPA: arylesterase [Caulobacteraceae bacterium]|jgi:acyl-CoA thioesterase-1
MTHRSPLLTRRGAFAGLAAVFAAQAAPARAPLSRAKPKVITILGDSLTAGRGLAYRDSLPAQLQAELKRRGANVVVRGAGVSGDTSSGGLARVDFSVRGDTDLAIVALGANDLLQGLPPASMQRNLTAIVRRLKRRGIKVLLVTFRAPPIINQAYAAQYNAVFDNIARAEGVPLHRNFLQGVVGVPALNLSDRIHPNPRGIRIVASRLADSTLPALPK